MKHKRKINTIYLSGKMTGVEDFNQPLFQKAAGELRAQGYDVFVPGENEEYDDIEKLTWEVQRQKREFYMSRDILFILEKADAVVVLPGWEQSEGAKLEVLTAQAVGVPVFEFATAALLRKPVWMIVPSDYDC